MWGCITSCFMAVLLLLRFHFTIIEFTVDWGRSTRAKISLTYKDTASFVPMFIYGACMPMCLILCICYLLDVA